ncbi:MAG TPA: 1,4-dihydroxy-6-naphthoate synthase [Nitrospirae bacterium]|nr:1,4-dihydroxy-6-naphtoate synthase [bacterium BMS3Abin09]GBE41672.1 1,4-dihydroxy-6-naphtoate synthase [bacterium BMS3Bbin09]HDH33952.1 1,4-dihydroxy-6-naphthoate synthase [Nitrospirota bacterium]HDO67021.1 1,4-dihydroxy-6-naphthoate synthase [Nitrospirota bacterium]HDZ84292.1 1,4-dihydroxy-6-naphthoate synthase [Nitrospirota bacterium]
MKELTLGYSPCPNDTFIFYAMIHGKIDTGGLEFKETLLDVETLNQRALNAVLDLTKISYHAFGHMRDNYALLRSGSALGRGCGPIVVTKDGHTMEELRGKKIAIPGKLTTAALLLQLYDRAFVNSSNLIIMPFHEIMDAVANGDVDAGVIIHESRFTYVSYGLSRVIDLGQWWEKETGLPIPLGGILAKRELGRELILKVEDILRQSIEYSYNNRFEPMGYIKKHSQELSDGVIKDHIKLYVNDFTIDIGAEGEKAISELISRAEDNGIIKASKKPLFI